MFTTIICTIAIVALIGIVYAVGNAVSDIAGLCWFKNHKQALLNGESIPSKNIYDAFGNYWFENNKHTLNGF